MALPLLKTSRLIPLAACLLTASCAMAPRTVVERADVPHGPEYEWQASGEGFGAAVVVTADPEWKRKWGTPAPRLPRIDQARSLRIGQKVWTLLFLTNPSADLTGTVDVTCDLRMIRPNGRVTERRGLRALRIKTVPVPRTYMSEFVLTMEGEENDPLGEWIVEFVVHDNVRGVALPLTGRYTLQPRG